VVGYGGAGITNLIEEADVQLRHAVDHVNAEEHNIDRISGNPKHQGHAGFGFHKFVIKVLMRLRIDLFCKPQTHFQVQDATRRHKRVPLGRNISAVALVENHFAFKHVFRAGRVLLILGHQSSSIHLADSPQRVLVHGAFTEPITFAKLLVHLPRARLAVSGYFSHTIIAHRRQLLRLTQDMVHAILNQASADPFLWREYAQTLQQIHHVLATQHILYTFVYSNVVHYVPQQVTEFQIGSLFLIAIKHKANSFPRKQQIGVSELFREKLCDIFQEHSNMIFEEVHGAPDVLTQTVRNLFNGFVNWHPHGLCD